MGFAHPSGSWCTRNYTCENCQFSVTLKIIKLFLTSSCGVLAWHSSWIFNACCHSMYTCVFYVVASQWMALLSSDTAPESSWQSGEYQRVGEIPLWLNGSYCRGVWHSSNIHNDSQCCWHTIVEMLGGIHLLWLFFSDIDSIAHRFFTKYYHNKISCQLIMIQGKQRE